MLLTGIADPKQLAILTAAVDDYCRPAGIEPGSQEREAVARLVMTLFNNGASTAEQLKAALLDRSDRDAKRYG